MKFNTKDRICKPLPKQSKTPLILAIVAVSGVFAAGIFFIQGEQLGFMPPDKSVAFIKSAEKAPQRPGAIEKREGQVGPVKKLRQPNQDESFYIRMGQKVELAASEMNSEGKQVVFNDKNYQPRKIDNVIQSVSAPARPVKRKSPPVQRSAPWSWTTYSIKERSRKITHRGSFTYFVANGMVLTNTVCQNETVGTERYRNCRKGAKEYFKRNCSNANQVACTGADLSP